MKPQRHAPMKKTPCNGAQKTAQDQKLAQMERQATREYRARMFRQWVITATIATGLVFMAVGIPGGETIALTGSTLLAGHSLSSKVIGRH